MITDEECPGSVDENKHFLSIISEETGNKICTNDRCYFVIKYKDGSGAWQGNFNSITAKNFIKESID
jgi:hypothetical protein